MCDCVPSILQPYCVIAVRKSAFTRWNCRLTISVFLNTDRKSVRNGRLQLLANSFEARNSTVSISKSRSCVNVTRNLGMVGSEDYELNSELGFKKKEEKRIGLKNSRSDSTRENSGGSDIDFLEFDGSLVDEERMPESERSLSDGDDLVGIQGSRCVDSKTEDSSVELNGRPRLRSGRQVVKRSSILAKQVISIQTARSLGFVSQLWVDITSWAVLLVEVRPSLLSGESERLLLRDVSQVGDVVLVQDESLMEHELKMVGLETLVGYDVVTPGRRNIGKVRGYSFNINSGAVESLELDSFGISIIPSSLVSTYALFVEDVLEVVPDTIVVHEGTALHLQRLTKGFWKTQNARSSMDGLREYSDLENPVRSDNGQSIKRNFRGQKYQQNLREFDDDWELPMDYL